jgi:beta-RFAP synthase
VSAPSRLHLGLIDSTGVFGRRFGSIGVALATPRTELVAESAAGDDETVVAPGLLARVSEAEGAELARRLAEILIHHRLAGLPAPAGARVRLDAAPPAHAGFGSGTQLALALGTALSLLDASPLDAVVIGRALRRGRRSGVGLAAFATGGLIVDGGHPVVPDEEPAGSPPVLARHPLPDAWRFVVVVPAGARGLSGAAERAAFARLPRGAPERVAEICAAVLLGLLPAAVEGNLVAFGAALTRVQRLVGDSLAAVQEGRFATPLVAALVAALLDGGAAGAGQSSWGPACYGVVGSQADAERLAGHLGDWLAAHAVPGAVLVAAPDNDGARVDVAG